MRISAKIDYACRALLELSLHWPNKDPLPISAIAKRQEIPIQFLTQILITLKQLGYTTSMRGKNGGYLLSKKPIEIKLDQLITDLGSVGYCMAEKHASSSKLHVMDAVWDEIDKAVLHEMSQINFEIISNRYRSKENSIMYDI